MKSKKKGSNTVKKAVKKASPRHQLFLVQKTIATTKEKTYNTIQEPVQIKDAKMLPRSARNHVSRISCLEKMQEYDLSPFSSPGRNSLSPHYRKMLSPYARDDKEKVKFKAKSKAQLQKGGQKKKVDNERKEVKMKQKMTKEQCNSAYHNQFLKKFDEKKITEMSQESEASASKLNKRKNLNLKIDIENVQKDLILEKVKDERITELLRKIKNHYRRELPSFKSHEIKFLCSIILIQRLWRQKRMKKFINNFISPRSLLKTTDLRDSNIPGLDFTLTTEAQTSELIRKYHNVVFQKKIPSQDIVQEVHSTELIKKEEEKINLQDLQLSAEFSPQKQEKVVQFVEYLRDIKFEKCPKAKKSEKFNVFNLESSLSDKCLMQNMYRKVFSESSKKSNLTIFKERKQQKNLERSIEMINNMNSPQNKELVIIGERFETEMQSKDTIEIKQPVLTHEISVETDPNMLKEPENKEIKTMKEAHQMADFLIMNLINEFATEYQDFASKSTLKKKKKSTLPGLKSSPNSIRQYLTGLTSYMLKQYGEEITRRFSLIKPLSFLKIHHQYDEDDEYIEEEEDDDINLPIVPQTLYYEYEQMYEAEHFIIPESQKKYSNFLESLIKIHNLLLINCLSEMIEKTRMDRIVLPWDNSMSMIRRSHKFNERNVQFLINDIIDEICKSAFMRVGQFHRNIEENREQRLLKSINMEYKNEGSDWSIQYEYLEMRMDMTKFVEEILLEEVANEIMIFI